MPKKKFNIDDYLDKRRAELPMLKEEGYEAVFLVSKSKSTALQSWILANGSLSKVAEMTCALIMSLAKESGKGLNKTLRVLGKAARIHYKHYDEAAQYLDKREEEEE